MIGPIFVGIKDNSIAGCLLIPIKIFLKVVITMIAVWADYTWLPLIIVMVVLIIIAELYL